MADTIENHGTESLQTQFANALQLHRQGRLNSAIAIYQTLIKHSNNWPILHYNCGVAFFQSRQFTDALSAFQEAVYLADNFPEAWYSGGNCHRILGDFEQAIQWYHQAISLNSKYTDAVYNMANSLKEIGVLNKAIEYYQTVLALEPNFPSAWNNLGITWMQIGRFDASESAFKRALKLSPDLLDAKYNLGLVSKRQGKIDAAIHYCHQVLEQNADHPKALSLLISLLQETFQWQALIYYELKLDKVTARQLVDGQCPAESPFLSFSRSPDPLKNMTIARAWSTHVRGNRKQSTISVCRQDGNESGKITVGYLSEQFRNAATAHLTAGLFGLHDRARFNVYAYSLGRDDQSSYRQRIEKGVDLFRDISKLSVYEATAQIQADKVDILVDLIGWMHGHRIGILAQRAAPIQINYLGFPGTMGSHFHDYIIADSCIIPLEHTEYYTEKIIRMPHTYQVTDAQPSVDSTVPSRMACGLPEKGVVFCSFNTDYKIDNAVFDAWMDILTVVQDSVLWLLVRSPTARRNLLAHAVHKGIPAKRIIFAEALSKERHLARLKLADIALDTWRVNGHTTTSDALWAGIPVVAKLGRHFASRVSASILSAIGLEEMVTFDSAAYREKAISLAKDPVMLSLVKQRLSRNIKTKPLFRTDFYTGHLEQAYSMIWQSHLAGKGPAHVTISDD